MATSRAMSRGDERMRLPVAELIPAAGSWTKQSPHPTSGGSQFMAVSGGLTARRTNQARAATEHEARVRPGTHGRNGGSLKNQVVQPLLKSQRLAATAPSGGSRFAPRPVSVLEKNCLEREWHQQRRELRRSPLLPSSALSQP